MSQLTQSSTVDARCMDIARGDTPSVWRVGWMVVAVGHSGCAIGYGHLWPGDGGLERSHHDGDSGMVCHNMAPASRRAVDWTLAQVILALEKQTMTMPWMTAIVSMDWR
jgi:hypothetical protein